MNTIFEISIENPFSPALLVAGIVAFLVLLLGIILEAVFDGDAGGGAISIGVMVAGVGMLIASIIILGYDEDARIERITAAITEAGYSNVVVDDGTITASGPDGEYISGFYHAVNDSKETYSVALESK